MNSPDNTQCIPNNSVARRSVLRGLAGLGIVGLLPARATAAAKKKKTTTATTVKPVATTIAKTTPSAKPAVNSTGPSFNEALELLVSFTFATTQSRVRNPYVAIWLEDASGQTVRTIDLSIQLGKGLEYVQHLTRWNTADQSRISKGGKDTIETISSATRVPGSYDVTWNGRNDANTLVPQGNYVLNIEGAREHGPYEIVRQEIAIGGHPFEEKLSSNGELQNVVVKLRAKA